MVLGGTRFGRGWEHVDRPGEQTGNLSLGTRLMVTVMGEDERRDGDAMRW